MKEKIKSVKMNVEKILADDKTGHNMDHINRVYELSMKFCSNENCDKYIVSLIALLHDVDDYKLVGIENSANLTNAVNIMNCAGIDMVIQSKVLDGINNMGYSKSLKGIRPVSIEGKIVSDADMCDAIGANGILRSHAYLIKKGKSFFNKDIFPIENLSADEYVNKSADTSVCHFFEKSLKLKKLMLTDSGKKEAEKRHEFMVNFLHQFFYEENSSEWKNYLENYLKVEYTD